MGPQTCLRTKNLNKCSIAKLSQMTAPSVGLQRANRNRIKLYAYVKHSMLTFTRKSVNKIISFTILKDKKYIALEQV